MKHAFLFIPFVLAYLTQDWPVLSYWISWAGSLLILWATLTGRIKALPRDRPALYQIFRPIFFTQVIFAGYTCLTSVFYFVSLSQDAAAGLPDALRVLPLAAKAQSYYVLGHASLVTGILAFMDYRDSDTYHLVWRLGANRLLVGLSAMFLGLTVLLSMEPRLLQVSIRISQLAMVASVFSLGLSLIHRERTYIMINVPIFLTNFLVALMSGWKEQTVIIMLLFFATIFPYYRRAATIAALASLGVFLTVMPAYNSMFRDLAWRERVAPRVAMRAAIARIRSGELKLAPARQEFLTHRITEIAQFVGYVGAVPARIPFYGSQILAQTAGSLVPRALWREKPNTERLVMERVYETGVYDRASTISAKPQFVADSYLLGGIPAIFVFCCLYGMLASVISRIAERWFGGYTIGSGLVFAGLFQIFWRGNAFEFFFPMILWSFLLMWGLFVTGVVTRVLVRDNPALKHVFVPRPRPGTRPAVRPQSRAVLD